MKRAKKIEKMMIGKGAIFRALESTFIQKLFRKKKKLFFPSVKGEISDISIERISPLWAKSTCLVRYKILFNNENQKIFRGTAKTSKSRINFSSVWVVFKAISASNNLA